MKLPSNFRVVFLLVKICPKISHSPGKTKRAAERRCSLRETKLKGNRANGYTAIKLGGIKVFDAKKL